MLQSSQSQWFHEPKQKHQLRVLRERGGDLMIFSPRASAMEQHVPDAPTAVGWARASNDLVHRVTTLYPEHFAGVCQLPQTPGGGLADSQDQRVVVSGPRGAPAWAPCHK
jgi:4-oxalmesaconate hydratase